MNDMQGMDDDTSFPQEDVDKCVQESVEAILQTV